jgi:DNA-binding response OmpR family regulator
MAEGCGMMDQHTRIRQLEIEKQRLLDEIDVLKDALSGAPAPLPVEWGLTPSQAGIMRLLIKRGTATYAACMAALYSDRVAQPDVKIISVFILRMRKKLKPFGVEIRTLWGVGYALDEATRSRFKERQAA